MCERIVSKVGVFKIHADVTDYRLSIFKFFTFLFLFFYFVCRSIRSIRSIRFIISLFNLNTWFCLFREICFDDDSSCNINSSSSFLTRIEFFFWKHREEEKKKQKISRRGWYLYRVTLSKKVLWNQCRNRNLFPNFSFLRILKILISKLINFYRFPRLFFTIIFYQWIVEITLTLIFSQLYVMSNFNIFTIIYE